MTVREPNILARLWHWLAGEARAETSREAELRTAVSERDVLLASLRTELAMANSTIRVQQLEIELLTASHQHQLERVRAATAAETFHRAAALRGKE